MLIKSYDWWLFYNPTQEKPHWLKFGIENLMTPVGTVPKGSNPNISIILHIIM